MAEHERFTLPEIQTHLAEVRRQIEILQRIEASLLSMHTILQAMADSQGDVIESLYRIESNLPSEKTHEEDHD